MDNKSMERPSKIQLILDTHKDKRIRIKALIKHQRPKTIHPRLITGNILNIIRVTAPKFQTRRPVRPQHPRDLPFSVSIDITRRAQKHNPLETGNKE